MGVRLIGESIPKSSLKDKILAYITHVAGDRNILRFVLQGTVFLSLKQFPTIMGTYIRPVVYRIVMGKTGKGCLIERNVRLEIPLRIYMNDRVFIGENCWISAGGMTGEILFENDAFIAHGCTLTGQGGKITIGKHVHVSRNTYINGIGVVEIGHDTMLGPNVVLISGNHGFDNLDIPIRLQEGEKKKITIEENVWIATNVCVMPGVTIGKGSVVGAGAVVTKDLPPHSVAGGVPAKIIRSRQKKQEL